MNYALIFAGGVGNRMKTKSKPKQFLEVHGKPIIVHTIEHFNQHPDIDAICVVIVKEWIGYMEELKKKYQLHKVNWIIEGGETALESQYKGLDIIKNSELYDNQGIVLIHDGVRPLISERLISDCIHETKEYGSAVVVAPAIETIIRVNENNMIKDTFPRNECQLARAPQTFYIKEILKYHEESRKDHLNHFVDSTSLMLYYDQPVHTLKGPSENIKVTTPSDFYICRALLDAKENSQLEGMD